MTLYRSCSLRKQRFKKDLYYVFLNDNLNVVNGEAKKKKKRPDVIREANDELNVSTSVFSSGLELNCHQNTNES